MSRWTADDVPDQSGRTILITGANSGLGYQSSVALARKGARVLMGCRDPRRAAAALVRLRSDVAGAQAEVVPLDLASLASIEQAATDVASRTSSLDVLINNAGVMAVGQTTTADGFEMQFGTNHLGHFALTGRLAPLLRAASDPRVVTVSSGAHRIGTMDFDDLMRAKKYQRWAVYGQSKLANLLFTAELDRRCTWLTAAAAHPGYASTHLQSGQGVPVLEAVMKLGNRVMAQSDAMGALPQLYAATMPDVKGNDYYGPGLLELRGFPRKVGRTSKAASAEDARRLWEISEDLTKVTF